MTSAGYPLPVARMADSLLDLLMAETKRLIQEKEYAVHAVANALMERGELIGAELEAVFEAADAANPEHAAPFQRRLVTLPKLFQDPAQAGAGQWPVAAEAEPAAIRAAVEAELLAMLVARGATSAAAPVARSDAVAPAASSASRGRWRPEDG
jgi:hypothetical protein